MIRITWLKRLKQSAKLKPMVVVSGVAQVTTCKNVVSKRVLPTTAETTGISTHSADALYSLLSPRNSHVIILIIAHLCMTLLLM